MDNSIIVFFGLVLLFIIVLFLFMKRLVVVPPNKILIINTLNGESKIHVVGKVFVWPVIQSYETIDLKLYSFNIKDNYLTKDNHDFEIISDTSCGISLDPNIVDNVLLIQGKDEEVIGKIIKDIIIQIYNEFIIEYDIIDILTKFDKKLKKDLIQKLDLELKKIGFTIISTNIKKTKSQKETSIELESKLRNIDFKNLSSEKLDTIEELNLAIEKNSNEREMLYAKKIKKMNELIKGET